MTKYYVVFTHQDKEYKIREMESFPSEVAAGDVYKVDVNSYRAFIVAHDVENWLTHDTLMTAVFGEALWNINNKKKRDGLWRKDLGQI